MCPRGGKTRTDEELLSEPFRSSLQNLTWSVKGPDNVGIFIMIELKAVADSGFP